MKLFSNSEEILICKESVVPVKKDHQLLPEKFRQSFLGLSKNSTDPIPTRSLAVLEYSCEYN